MMASRQHHDLLSCAVVCLYKRDKLAIVFSVCLVYTYGYLGILNNFNQL